MQEHLLVIHTGIIYKAASNMAVNYLYKTWYSSNSTFAFVGGLLSDGHGAAEGMVSSIAMIPPTMPSKR